MCHGPRAAAKCRPERSLHTPAPTAIVFCVPVSLHCHTLRAAAGRPGPRREPQPWADRLAGELTKHTQSLLSHLSKYGHFLFKTNIKHFCQFLTFISTVCAALCFSRMGTCQVVCVQVDED